MADAPPGVIKISADEYDKLYPLYEWAKIARPKLKFQEWLREQREVEQRVRKRA